MSKSCVLPPPLRLFEVALSMDVVPLVMEMVEVKVISLVTTQVFPPAVAQLERAEKVETVKYQVGTGVIVGTGVGSAVGAGVGEAAGTEEGAGVGKEEGTGVGSVEGVTVGVDIESHSSFSIPQTVSSKNEI